MNKLSNTQRIALKEINRVTERFGKDRWFTQGELIGIGENTLLALVSKKHLNYYTESDISYYQLRPKEEQSRKVLSEAT